MVRPAGIKAMHMALAVPYFQGLYAYSPVHKVDLKSMYSILFYIIFHFFSTFI